MACDHGVPPAILAVRQKLEKLGLVVSCENMKQHLSAKEMNAASGAFRYALQSDKTLAAKYSQMKRLEQKEWLCAFAIDSSVAKLSCSQITMKEKKQMLKERVVWLTQNQMASATWFASEEHAKIIADSPSTPSQLSTQPALREANIKEYRVEVTEEMWQRNNKETVQVKADSDLAKEDYDKVKASLETNDSPEAPKKKGRRADKLPVPALKDMTPEEKAIWAEQEREKEERRKICDAYRAALSQMKRVTDKVRKEMDAATGLAHKLEEKGFPKEMKQHYLEAVIPVMTLGNNSLEEWGTYAKANVLSGTSGDVEQIITKIEAVTMNVEARFKEVEKSHVKQLKSISK
jgi:hypothetical protein